MPWSTSDRRSTLPADWHAIRRRVLIRDGRRCQIPGCAEVATDVDHINDRHNHDLSNLQSLCPAHHRIKTVAEAHEAMRQQRVKARHPRERHPGLR